MRPTAGWHAVSGGPPAGGSPCRSAHCLYQQLCNVQPTAPACVELRVRGEHPECVRCLGIRQVCSFGGLLTAPPLFVCRTEPRPLYPLLKPSLIAHAFCCWRATHSCPSPLAAFGSDQMVGWTLHPQHSCKAKRNAVCHRE